MLFHSTSMRTQESAWQFHFFSLSRYFDDSDVDDSDPLPMNVRGTASEAMDHDIDLKKK